MKVTFMFCGETMTPEQVSAVHRFARSNGRNWRTKLRSLRSWLVYGSYWQNGGYHYSPPKCQYSPQHINEYRTLPYPVMDHLSKWDVRGNWQDAETLASKPRRRKAA